MKAPPSSPVPPDRTCSDILSAEELPAASVKSMVSNVEKISQSNPPKSPLLKAGYGVSDAASRYFFEVDKSTTTKKKQRRSSANFVSKFGLSEDTTYKPTLLTAQLLTSQKSIGAPTSPPLVSSALASLPAARRTRRGRWPRGLALVAAAVGVALALGDGVRPCDSPLPSGAVLRAARLNAAFDAAAAASEYYVLNDPALEQARTALDDATRHRVGSYARAVEAHGCAEGTALADGLARLRAFRAAASL